LRRRRRRAHERAEVRGVLAADVDGEEPLEGVLHVLAGHRAVDRRAELHARPDLDGDGLEITGDLGLARREVRDRIGRVVGLEAVERPLRRIRDLVATRVIGVARVEVVDVGRAELAEYSARLAPGLLVGRASSSRGARTGGGPAVATTTGGDDEGERGNDAREERS